MVRRLPRARLVPDNLKTGVTGHPREGEVMLNERYRLLADHYSAAVLPAKVRQPRGKASVENTVWHATMAVIGATGNRTFSSPPRAARGDPRMACRL